MYFHMMVKFKLLEHTEATACAESTDLIKGLIKLYFVQIVNTIRMFFIIPYSFSGRVFHSTV